jgi:hypothetical protein
MRLVFKKDQFDPFGGLEHATNKQTSKTAIPQSYQAVSCPDKGQEALFGLR